MLKEITIKNFRSYKNETTFSMEADYNRVSEHKNHCCDICGNKLLKVSSIYGPNGGGKTNLLSALAILPAILNYDRVRFRPQEIKCIFSENEDPEITAFFINDKYEIGCSFKIDFVVKRENSYGRYIFYTDINIKEECIVYRRLNEKNFTTLLKRDYSGRLVENNINNYAFAGNLSKTKSFITKIYEDFANNDYLDNEGLLIIKILYEQITSIENLEGHLVFSRTKFSLIDKYRHRLLNLLNDIDIKIKNISIHEERYYPIWFVREVTESGKKVLKEIPLIEESAGTKKVFNIFLNILSNENKIFYCDDLNAFLHPKMCKVLIEWFNSSFNKGSQLIFNSHDIINMNNTLFRRDEIWFSYRDETYSSHLVPLSNIVNYKGEQIRNDASYYKQYLEGKYGADPFIKKGLTWNE